MSCMQRWPDGCNKAGAQPLANLGEEGGEVEAAHAIGLAGARPDEAGKLERACTAERGRAKLPLRPIDQEHTQCLGSSCQCSMQQAAWWQ
jgi:hypothetical protein